MFPRLLLPLFLLPALVSAQRLPERIPYHKDGLWGYCDSTKKVIIAPAYSEAEMFVNGTAIVTSAREQKGLIDWNGRVLVPLVCSSITRLWNGKIKTAVETDEQTLYGLLDASGHQLLPPVNADIRYDSNIGSGNLLVETPEGEVGLIDSASGMLVIPPLYQSITACRHGYICENYGDYYFISRKGSLAMENPCSDISAFDENENYYRIEIRKHGHYSVGVMDTLGRIVLPAIYRDVDAEHNGNFLVETHKREQVWINSAWKPLYDPSWKTAEWMDWGRWLFFYKDKPKPGHFGIYDNRQHTCLAEPVYDTAYSVSDGDRLLYLALRKNGLTSLFDTNGMPALSALPFDIQWVVNPHLWTLRKGSKYGFYVPDGKIPEALLLDTISYLAPNLFAYRENGLYGIIDSSGRRFCPPQYHTIEYYHHGCAIVDKSGLVDSTGSELLAPGKYSRIRYIEKKNGDLFYIAERGDSSGLLDRSGKELLAPAYRSLYDYMYTSSFPAMDRNGNGVSIITACGHINIYKSRVTWWGSSIFLEGGKNLRDSCGKLLRAGGGWEAIQIIRRSPSSLAWCDGASISLVRTQPEQSTVVCSDCPGPYRAKDGSGQLHFYLNEAMTAFLEHFDSTALVWPDTLFDHITPKENTVLVERKNLKGAIAENGRLLPPVYDHLNLSPDGRYAAASHGSITECIELATGQVTMRLPSRWAIPVDASHYLLSIFHQNYGDNNSYQGILAPGPGTPYSHLYTKEGLSIASFFSEEPSVILAAPRLYRCPQGYFDDNGNRFWEE